MVPPCACTIRLAVTGGNTANHADAIAACQARRPDSRISNQISNPPVARLTTSNGSFSANTVGPVSRKTPAAIHACTPIMYSWP